jgi:hypothetical protein
MNLIISGSLKSLYSSRLYLFLHVPFFSSGPKIYLKILLSKILNRGTVFHPILTMARSQRHTIALVL